MKYSLKSKVATATTSALATLSLAVTHIYAQQQTTINVGGYTLDFGASFGTWGENPNQVITDVVNIVLAVAAIAAFLFILWGAFKYVTAGDDSSKTEAARKTITNAVVGLILVALSFVIWVIVINLTGLNFGATPTTGGTGT